MDSVQTLNTMIKHVHNAWLRRLATVILCLVGTMNGAWASTYLNYFGTYVPAFYDANLNKYVITGPNTCMLYGGGDFLNGNVVIPSTVMDSDDGTVYTITAIGREAFGGKKVTSIQLPNTIDSIAQSAFSGQEITTLELPNSLTQLGEGAFAHCKKLTSVSLPNSLITIGEGAFTGCQNLCSIRIPSSVRTIGGSAFYNCTNLSSIEWSDSLTTIGWTAFYGTNFTKIELPSTVDSIGRGAFRYNQNLKEITVAPNSKHLCSVDGIVYSINKDTLVLVPEAKTGEFEVPNTVQVIKSGAFIRSNFSKIKMSSVKVIEEEAFGSTLATEIDLGDSVTTVVYYGLHSGNLQTIKLSKALTYIGDEAFWSSGGQKIIVTSPYPCKAGSSLGDGVSLYLPTIESIERYKNAIGWKALSIGGFEHKFETESQFGYSTLYWMSPFILPEGVTAYTGSVHGHTLVLTEIKDTIPACTPVVLKGEPGSIYQINTCANPLTTAGENDLISSQFYTTVSSLDADYEPYTLSYLEDGDEITDIAFCRYVGTGLAAYKAYILLPKSFRESSESPTLRVVFGNQTDNVSGIEQVSTSTSGKADVIYDLRGRRIEHCSAPGLYVKNGRKVLVK